MGPTPVAAEETGGEAAGGPTVEVGDRGVTGEIVEMEFPLLRASLVAPDWLTAGESIIPTIATIATHTANSTGARLVCSSSSEIKAITSLIPKGTAGQDEDWLINLTLPSLQGRNRRDGVAPA